MHLDYDCKDDEARDFIDIQGKSGMKLDGLVEGTSVEWKLDTGAATFITRILIIASFQNIDLYLSALGKYSIQPTAGG
jgi:hypothetical protein